MTIPTSMVQITTTVMDTKNKCISEAACREAHPETN